MFPLRILLAFVPVTLFLSSLIYLDSYKLVRLSRILQLIGAGGVAAALAWAIHRGALVSAGMDSRLLTWIAVPGIEELLKAVPIVLLLRSRRIGFLADAAIFGFAIGTGFALMENLYYLIALQSDSIPLWLVRGFGTAVMHGGTTAIVAMTAKVLCQRRDSESPWLVVPGLAVALAIHATFNHFLLSPLVTAIAVTATLPPLLALVFAESERYLKRWLGSGFDLAAELLQVIRSGDFAASRPGHYLQSLRENFDGPIVADMLCYLRLHTELSLRAKGMLMLRESGLPMRRDAEVAEKIEELRYLKKSIGKMGELALSPILQASSEDVWQLYLLESA